MDSKISLNVLSLDLGWYGAILHLVLFFKIFNYGYDHSMDAEGVLLIISIIAVCFAFFHFVLTVVLHFGSLINGILEV